MRNDMEQKVHTAINNLDRCDIQTILETDLGFAVYDDESTQVLQDYLRDCAMKDIRIQRIILYYPQAE